MNSGGLEKETESLAEHVSDGAKEQTVFLVSKCSKLFDS
jgi:hypothetical protein